MSYKYDPKISEVLHDKKTLQPEGYENTREKVYEIVDKIFDQEPGKNPLCGSIIMVFEGEKGPEEVTLKIATTGMYTNDDRAMEALKFALIEVANNGIAGRSPRVGRSNTAGLLDSLVDSIRGYKKER